MLQDQMVDSQSSSYWSCLQHMALKITSSSLRYFLLLPSRTQHTPGSPPLLWAPSWFSWFSWLDSHLLKAFTSWELAPGHLLLFASSVSSLLGFTCCWLPKFSLPVQPTHSNFPSLLGYKLVSQNAPAPNCFHLSTAPASYPTSPRISHLSK